MPRSRTCKQGDDLAVVTKSKKEEAEERALQKYNQAAFVDSMAWKDEEALLQVAPSSSLVKIDDNGDPYQDRSVDWSLGRLQSSIEVNPSLLYSLHASGRPFMGQNDRRAASLMGSFRLMVVAVVGTSLCTSESCPEHGNGALMSSLGLSAPLIQSQLVLELLFKLMRG